ncbi:hypothetical protein ACN47E_005107 [Coniothyrium glycines]
MHILGLCNGSVGGNSEVLLKNALVSAQTADPSITTSWIHIPSVSYPANPQPFDAAPDISLGTNASNNKRGGVQESTTTTRDDRKKVFNAILDADALIFSTAIYSHQPGGALKALLDTLLGPYTDAAFARRVLAGKQAGDARFASMSVDERVLRPRVAGFLAVGGSTTPDQFTMALPTLHILITSLQAKVVDQVVFAGHANPGAVLRSAEAVERAQRLGRNVAREIGKTYDEAVFLGEEPEGACPECHLAKLDFFGGPENAVGCVVCGNTGRLVGGAKVSVQWDEASDYCCLTMKGKEKHIDDIFKNGTNEWKGLDADEAFTKKLQDWRGRDCGKIEF